jgi:hypothetical protein
VPRHSPRGRDRRRPQRAPRRRSRAPHPFSPCDRRRRPRAPALLPEHPADLLLKHHRPSSPSRMMSSPPPASPNHCQRLPHPPTAADGSPGHRLCLLFSASAVSSPRLLWRHRGRGRGRRRRDNRSPRGGSVCFFFFPNAITYN